MADLYIMIGCPGSGKSSYISEIATEEDAIVSRDRIRFELLSDDDDYFKKENEVFNIYVDNIIQNLREGKDVYADATHISKGSRRKLLNRIPRHLYKDLHAIYMRVPFQIAASRNRNRKGRACVPENVMNSMYNRLEEPMFEEGFDYITIVDLDKITFMDRGQKL